MTRLGIIECRELDTDYETFCQKVDDFLNTLTEPLEEIVLGGHNPVIEEWVKENGYKLTILQSKEKTFGHGTAPVSNAQIREMSTHVITV